MEYLFSIDTIFTLLADIESEKEAEMKRDHSTKKRSRFFSFLKYTVELPSL